jgi:hypothetical protein
MKRSIPFLTPLLVLLTMLLGLGAPRHKRRRTVSSYCDAAIRIR